MPSFKKILRNVKNTPQDTYKHLFLLFDHFQDPIVDVYQSFCLLALPLMPSFKKDDKSSPSNYRPISLLSCAGKVMERVVYKYICNYIIEHSLLYSYQGGFLPGHSTVYQLLEIYLHY
jgi:hypothetical protein